MAAKTKMWKDTVVKPGDFGLVRKPGQIHLSRIVNRKGNNVEREDPIKDIALGMREK